MKQAAADKIIRYYHGFGSRLGYRLVLGGNKHFGYYPDKQNSISMRCAMVNMQQQLSKVLEIKPGSKVLDAGCGMGDTARYIARDNNAQVLGIDLLDFNIAAARKKLTAAENVTFEVGDYTESGLPNSEFDAIYTLETLVHAPDYQSALEEFHRILKPKGRLVLFEYSHAGYGAVDESLGDAFRSMNKYAAMPSFDKFSHGVLEASLKQAGFKVSAVTDISEYMKPMVRRFWQLAIVPYQFVKLFRLQKYFVNTMAGYELYKHFKHFRYNIFIAEKLT